MAASTSNRAAEDEQQVRWEYPRLEMQSGKYKLLLAGKENVREVVWNRLKVHGDGANPQQLMNLTAFKDYLRYPNKVIRSNKLIHYLIAREVVGDPDPDPTAIFFRVNNKVVRFGRTEFALVTGLKFGACPPTFDPFAVFDFSPQSLYARFFEKKAVTADELWAFFTDDSKFEQMTTVDCLRLGQVVIAVHTLLGLESSNKVPEWVWALIEQQPVWNAFPWGSVSFQVLLKNLKSVRYSIPLKSYHLNGNVLAFLGWIYEAFPEMGKSIGGRIAEKEGHRPRGVRYAYSKADSYGKILTEEVPTSLAADPDELNEPYMTTLERPGTPFTFQYDPSRVSLARAARAPRAKRRRGTSDEGNEEEAEAQVQAEGAEVQPAEEAEVPTESRGGKRAKVKDLVAREVGKVKDELKQELMGSFAEHVAGLVFEKLKAFNFNQSGHVEAGGSSGRGEGNDELVDVEDEELQAEEREGDAAADEDEEEEEAEEAEEHDVEGSRGAVSVGQQTAVGSTVEGSRGAAYVGPKTRFRSRFHLVNEPIDADAPLTETDREQLQRFERDMTEAPLPNLMLDAAPTEPRPLPNPFLDAAPSHPRPLPNPFLDPLPVEPEAAEDAPSADVGVEAEAAPTALQTYRRTLRPRKPAPPLKSPYLRK